MIDDKTKAEAIKVARLKMSPKGKQFRLRKLERITAAWLRKNEAEEKGEVYEPLNDEELFLQQRDFDMYYQDLAALSRYEGGQGKISQFPFYEQARKAIPDEREWTWEEDDEKDVAFLDAISDYFGDLSPEELAQMINGVQEHYVNPYAGVRRNDPCPCGSGKKFKHCHGKH